MAYTAQVKLSAGQVLTITADANSSGSFRRIDPTGANVQYASTDVAASASAVVGPFASNRYYELLSDTGKLTYSTAQKTETGSGQEVLDTGPSIASPALTSPTITGGTSTAQLVVTNVSASGAITIAAGIVAITKSSAVAVLTLAAPSADQEGIVIIVTSRTDKAHTITATGLLQDGVTGGAKDTATFAAFAGASITLAAINLTWHVVSLNAVTIS
jgi:hypothetical protein